MESPENYELWVDFVALFDQISLGYLVLSTAESDAQINKPKPSVGVDIGGARERFIAAHRAWINGGCRIVTTKFFFA